MAEKRASKVSGTCSTEMTAIGSGRRWALTASRTVSASQSLIKIDMRDLAQRMDAGIGPAGAVHEHHLAAERETAASSAPCTVGPFCWICQPTNGLPSYSMVSL